MAVKTGSGYYVLCIYIHVWVPPPSPLAVALIYIHIIIIPTRAEFGLVPTRSGGGGIWPASSLPATGPKPSFRSLSEENFLLYVYIYKYLHERSLFLFFPYYYVVAYHVACIYEYNRRLAY